MAPAQPALQVRPDTGPPRRTLSRTQLRRDTPGCEQVAHLNNAGAALSPHQVTDRVIRHLLLESMTGGYEAAEQVADELVAGRQLVAEFLGAQPGQIAFMESATAAWHRVLSTVSLQRGDRVLVAGAEYAATVLPLLQLSRRVGLHIDVIADGPDGSADPESVRRLLDDDVRLVCAVHAPSHNGLVNDVAAIGEAVRGSSAWYVVDACQSLGQLPVHQGDIGADFVIGSGRKYLRGPRGSGVLAVSDAVLERMDAFPVDVAGGRWSGDDAYTLAPSATRFESFERSVAVTLGFIEAVRYAQQQGVRTLQEAIARNAEYLRSHLGSLAGWQVQDRGRRRSGIVTVRHPRIPTGAALAALRADGINAWEVGCHLSPRELAAGPVLRFSPHAYNTPEELDRALQVLAGL